MGCAVVVVGQLDAGRSDATVLADSLLSSTGTLNDWLVMAVVAPSAVVAVPVNTPLR